MSKILIIGAGGVGRVVAHKMSRLSSGAIDIAIASRRPESCEQIARELKAPTSTQVADANSRVFIIKLMRHESPSVVINASSTHEITPLLEACLDTQAHYVDVSLGKASNELLNHDDYPEHRAFHDAFVDAGITAIPGLGFAPGVVNVFGAYAAKHHFDTLESIDIIDLDEAENGLPFTTGFDSASCLNELLSQSDYCEDGHWKRATPLSVRQEFDFPEVGQRQALLIKNTAVQSLRRQYPTLATARFWRSYKKNFLEHLKILQNVNFTTLNPVSYEGSQVIPLCFLKNLLPIPSTLGPRTRGKTSGACIMEGTKNGQPVKVTIYNVCPHEAAYEEARSQAIHYRAGVPPAIAARLILGGAWKTPGVYTPEQLDPDPFMAEIGLAGLPWRVREEMNDND